MTEADKDALNRMPDGWFEALSLPYMVKRPTYRCERLEKAGFISSRIVGVYPNIRREYCKIS